jgi:sodium/hydrogen exchanger 8
MADEQAEHEFGALNTLLLVVILGLVVIAAYYIKQNAFFFMPESAAAIFVGMMAGTLTTIIYPSTEEIQFLTLQPDIFFFILLPPIIFEAGYSVNKSSFFTNFWSIMLYAVAGTVISTFIIGYVVFGMGKLGMVNIDTRTPMEAMLFGALLSSIDPVATLSILGNPSLHCNALLYNLVFGESVLNDAVAIVLFKTFYSFVEHVRVESYPGENSVLAMGQFTLICVGSTLAGVFIALICSFVCKRTSLKQYPEYEIAILFICAYGSYSFAEAVGASGIMSLFFCGIVLSHYNMNNLSATSRLTSHYIFKTLASISEFLVYLYIGMGLCTGQLKHFNILFFLCTLIACIISRFFNIFPLSLLLNFGRKEYISLRVQLMQWFAGLRGAISFVLVS